MHILTGCVQIDSSRLQLSRLGFLRPDGEKVKYLANASFVVIIVNYQLDYFATSGIYLGNASL